MLDPNFAALDEEEQAANNALPISPLADITTHENIPQVTGTPQVTNAVQIQGTPQFRGGVAGHGTIPQPYPPAVPPPGMGHNAGFMGEQPSAHMPSARQPPETPLPPSMIPRTARSLRDQKWLRIGLISGLVLVIFLLGGMGLTLISSTPALSLDGGTTVAQGGTLHLSGSHFLSGGTVILTLDHTTPLYSAYHSPENTITSSHLYTINTLLLNNRITQRTIAGNSIKVSKDGSFRVNIQVGLDWKLGDHSIQANEGSGARIASLAFTVTQPTPVPSEETVTPTKIETITPTTKTDSPGIPPSITAVVTPQTLVASGLSGVAPGLLTFGPANEGDQQASTSGVVLATTGTALITWNASWDQKQAPWLQMKPTTGQIQAPASQKIAVSASPANLKAGTYKALITFTNTLNAQTVTLNVVLTIQASCLKATPTSLAFTSTIGAADPTPQTVTINTCGQASKWSATTSANSTWLSIKPTSGAIAQNGTQDVAVAVTSQKLAAGSYQGQVVLSNGTTQVTIPITLTIQSAPQLAVSQSSITVAKMCQLSAGTWTCTETLSSSSTQVSLDWTASSNASGTVTMTPTSGTIANGQTTSVSIAIPTASCAANFTLTFTGPANSVAVPIDCSNTQETPQVK
ncbi:hypothetical protein KSF_068900 [Reticulibacter mediterranei]|uniref:BACON domain-containing protein n=2 Tax=Reticulibacter mediterranei TaxID=2778369 RepID=A0A8J3N768_9CHLR|nr:hypothetical protein KSF_068900 [Reticulibacter mediterranei]